MPSQEPGPALGISSNMSVCIKQPLRLSSLGAGCLLALPLPQLLSSYGERDQIWLLQGCSWLVPFLIGRDEVTQGLPYQTSFSQGLRPHHDYSLSIFNSSRLVGSLTFMFAEGINEIAAAKTMQVCAIPSSGIGPAFQFTIWPCFPI